MKRFHWLVVGLALAGLAVGCGDDDGGGGGTDSGPGVDSGGGTDAGGGGLCEAEPASNPATCPSGAAIPDEDGLMGACCARVSNADRTAAPEFRISALRIQEPATLSASLVRSALAAALDEERFNWLIRLEGAEADGPVTITTGFGQRNADATFAFTDGTAPAPGDPNRWNAMSVEGTLAGEEITAPPIADTFTVPILEDDGVAVVLELPLRAFTVSCTVMSEDRTCIGLRDGNVYRTGAGNLTTYVTIEDAMMGRVAIPPIDTTLCNFVAGMASNEGLCTDVPQADWPTPPNAVCTGGTCSDTCDVASECNAWRISGGFAAHGVEIAE
ncbi:MAG: hypothetical protein AAGE52_00890 [Myxococcota bacterium]